MTLGVTLGVTLGWTSVYYLLYTLCLSSELWVTLWVTLLVIWGVTRVGLFFLNSLSTLFSQDLGSQLLLGGFRDHTWVGEFSLNPLYTLSSLDLSGKLDLLDLMGGSRCDTPAPCATQVRECGGPGGVQGQLCVWCGGKPPSPLTRLAWEVVSPLTRLLRSFSASPPLCLEVLLLD